MAEKADAPFSTLCTLITLNNRGGACELLMGRGELENPEYIYAAALTAETAEGLMGLLGSYLASYHTAKEQPTQN